MTLNNIYKPYLKEGQQSLNRYILKNNLKHVETIQGNIVSKNISFQLETQVLENRLRS